jgi:NitT/TauT family transport system permease protein
VKRIARLAGLHARPTRLLTVLLALIPFALAIGVYLSASRDRLRENPDDKLLPSIAKMATAVERMALTRDKRSDEYLMLKDTVSSLKRIVIGVGAAGVTGLFMGLNMGMLPGVRALLHPFVRFLSIVPPLAILPILFITFGVDELGKVMLIFLGTLFLIIRDIHLSVVKTIPREQIVKALTLGATQMAVVYRIVLPQIIPRLVHTVRISLGPAWLFLIASEAISSTSGLGYRIFLVRRYLAMDIIIPYVLWITFLGFLMDWILSRFVKWRYPWYSATQ